MLRRSILQKGTAIASKIKFKNVNKTFGCVNNLRCQGQTIGIIMKGITIFLLVVLAGEIDTYFIFVKTWKRLLLPKRVTETNSPIDD